MQIEKVPLSHHPSALSMTKDSCSDQTMKVLESRVTNSEALGHSGIIDWGIWCTEITLNDCWNGIAQVCKALLVLGAASEFRDIETAMYTKLGEGELEAVVPQSELDCVGHVEGDRPFLEGESS